MSELEVLPSFICFVQAPIEFAREKEGDTEGCKRVKQLDRTKEIRLKEVDLWGCLIWRIYGYR